MSLSLLLAFSWLISGFWTLQCCACGEHAFLMRFFRFSKSNEFWQKNYTRFASFFRRKKRSTGFSPQKLQYLSVRPNFLGNSFLMMYDRSYFKTVRCNLVPRTSFRLKHAVGLKTAFVLWQLTPLPSSFGGSVIDGHVKPRLVSLPSPFDQSFQRIWLRGLTRGLTYLDGAPCACHGKRSCFVNLSSYGDTSFQDFENEKYIIIVLNWL